MKRLVVSAGYRFVLLCAFALTLVLFACAPANAHAATLPQLYSDTLFSKGSTIPVTVSAQFNQPTTRTLAMKLIRQYRQEALNEGIVKLPAGMTRSQYLNGFVWDADLERIAMQRAVEAALYRSHTRPCNQKFSTAYTKNRKSTGEILAWNSGTTIERGMQAWKREKADYLKKIRGQKNYGETGHYELLIDPTMVTYGFSWVKVPGTKYASCQAGEMSRTKKKSGSLSYKGTYNVKVHVRQTSALKVSMSVSAQESPLMLGSTTKVTARATLSTAPKVKATVSTAGFAYTSSNPSVAPVGSNGTITGKKEGNATITVKAGGKTLKFAIKVAKTIPMYRLYNPKTKEHLYTKSANEKKVLSTKKGWRYEGIAWYAPVKSSVPVYRLYHAKSKAHHYTTSRNERNTLVKKKGWKYEGIAWYSCTTKDVPVYRLVHPKKPLIAAHHFTTSAKEKNTLIKKSGWKYEGVAWYGCATKTALKK